MFKQKGKKEAAKIANEWRERINTAFSDGDDGWLLRVIKVFDELKAGWDRGLENTGREDRTKAGSIGFELLPARQELKKMGLTEDDETLELHLEEFYKRSEQKGFREAILKDLGKVAEIVIDRFPHVKGVTGFSWLLDHPLTRQLGFQAVETENGVASRGGSTWLQFVDRHGQINKERLKQFLETGEFPMKAQLGFIPTIDFLRRFLPAERRGTITLQETNKGWREARRKNQKYFEKIKDLWYTLSVDDLEGVLNENEEVVDWLKKIGVKNRLFDFLIEFKKNGKDFEEIRNSEEAKELNEKIEAAVEKIDPSRSYTIEI